jgi:hypothetical protein
MNLNLRSHTPIQVTYNLLIWAEHEWEFNPSIYKDLPQNIRRLSTYGFLEMPGADSIATTQLSQPPPQHFRLNRSLNLRISCQGTCLHITQYSTANNSGKMSAFLINQIALVAGVPAFRWTIALSALCEGVACREQTCLTPSVHEDGGQGSLGFFTRRQTSHFCPQLEQ